MAQEGVKKLCLPLFQKGLPTSRSGCFLPARIAEGVVYRNVSRFAAAVAKGSRVLCRREPGGHAAHSATRDTSREGRVESGRLAAVDAEPLRLDGRHARNVSSFLHYLKTT